MESLLTVVPDITARHKESEIFGRLAVTSHNIGSLTGRFLAPTILEPAQFLGDHMLVPEVNGLTRIAFRLPDFLRYPRLQAGD